MIQQTSRTVYFSEVLPTLGERQQSVYEVLDRNYSITNAELKTLLGWEINTVTPRVNELVKKGLVYEVEKRKCKVTGRTAIAWGVTRNINMDIF